jgi:hypothetical protein
MSVPISPNTPTHMLEQQAAEQRRRLHNTVTTLREQVRETVQDKLDPRKRAREYVWQLAGGAFLLSFLIGSGTAGTIKQVIS